MKLSAVIFDLDGTLIDSEEAWGKAYVNVLKQKLNFNSKDPHPETPGVSVKNNWKLVLIKYDIKTNITLEELETLTYNEYQKFIPTIYLRDGALEFIANLKEAGYIIALATSSNWSTVDKVLDHLEIKNLFNSITTGEEVLESKPAPDIFLIASDKTGVDPLECLVVEDSPSGIEAAKQAGMKVIAITKEDGDGDRLEGADLIIEAFSEVTPKAIDQL
jgi:HAD superfamily hydrolase (TIGR01509 family)